MFINKVCNALKEEKIPYAIVGGMAVALHGAVRGTIDIDIIIYWNERNLRKVERVLNSLKLVSRIPITFKDIFHFRDEYIQNKNLIAWNFVNPQNPSEAVDIVITHDLKNYKTKTIKTKRGSIKILEISGLIEMKKKSNRLQDLEDVKALEKLL